MRKRFAYWLGLLIFVVVVSFVYLTTQSYSIYGGDAGDLVSAIITKGIAHPPGYPLYTALGMLFTSYYPWGSAAYKASFLSSLPTILSAILLFLFLRYLTKSNSAPLIASLAYSFLYPVWLYGVVPEVFALNTFFLISLFISGYYWMITGKQKYLFLTSFLFGLSLSHHHIVLFFVPTLTYFFWQRKGFYTTKNIIVSSLLFLLGLLPYSYVIVASVSHPGMNWLGSSTLANILGLILRRGYGTFSIGNFAANQLPLRFLSLVGLWDLMVKDFRIFGIMLMALGLLYLYRRKKVFYPLTIGIFSYVFFLFYASFPLTNNFMLGTFERFLIPLYLFFSMLICFGVLQIKSIFDSSRFIKFSKNKKKTVWTLVTCILLMYPLGLLKLNNGKIHSLRTDMTAENLALDILNSVPKNSIVILSKDTPLFNTQYLYYAQKAWPSVALVHLSKLQTPDYVKDLRIQYQNVSFPKESSNVSEVLNSIMDANYASYSIFGTLPLYSEIGSWEPWGLLYRFYKKADKPKDIQLLETNKMLWSLFHDPLEGSLSKYDHLLLSDVLSVYGASHQEIGFWMVKRHFLEDGQSHLLAAKSLDPTEQDTDVFLAQTYFMQKKCKEGDLLIEQMNKENDRYEMNYNFLQSINYIICKNDQKKAAEFERLYENASKQKETPLKTL